MKFDSHTSKRSLKSIRNFFADPLPRNKVLRITRIDITSTGFDIVYEACQNTFRIGITLPANLVEKLSDKSIDSLSPTFTAIAMAFAAFFFKLSDFSQVRMDAFGLDEPSKVFFSSFFEGGLGEFRYLQGLNPVRAVDVQSTITIESVPQAIETVDHVLMLNGGGKDSIVAGELLKRAAQPFTWVTIQPNKARQSVIDLSGNSSSIEIGCRFDPAIERLRAYPWGHFPHTSVVMSLGLLAAQLLGVRYVCVGNEHSANFGNVQYRGVNINHQYSKSSAYEVALSQYISRCVSPSIKVFSILRPFHDLQLARIFSEFPDYHSSFISCNIGISRDEWCKQCPKCAFTALALYPFIGKDGIVGIFGEDIMLRGIIRRHIIDLVRDGVKPWECVGTTDENRLALKLLLQANPDLQFTDRPTRKELEREVENVDLDLLSSIILERTEPDHCIPGDIVNKLNFALESINQGLISHKDTGLQRQGP